MTEPELLRGGRVCVVGSANTDMVVVCPHLPAPGETVLGGKFVTAQGGKGANQAVAAARCGAEVAFIACLGDDALGEGALKHYRNEGLDVSGVRCVAGEPSGVALIFVGEDGENEIVVASGANACLSVEDILTNESAIAEAAVLLTQLETPLPVVQQALELARARGVITILDPAPAQALPEDLLSLVDILTPNEHELGVLAGGENDSQRAAESLLASGVGRVLVTLGSEGVLLVSREGTQQRASFGVDTVDTTAAGDAFAGALAAALADGATFDQGVRFALAAGALSVTRRGAQPSLATRAECEEFLSKLT